MKIATTWQEVLKFAGSQQVRYVEHVEVNGQDYPAYQDYGMTSELIAYVHQ